MSEDATAAWWLVLMYQFPKGPDSRRVKVWRRLQSIGAVSIKNSVYVLPQNDQAQEDFAWLLQELRSSGADAAILESRFIDGMSDQQIRDLFNEARNADYHELRAEVDAAVALFSPDKIVDDERREAGHRVYTRARKRIAEIEAIDFFAAERHDETEMAVRLLEKHVTTVNADIESETGEIADPALQDLRGRVWVTRRSVRVDRIASAWLIRRWIDPDATFKFVSGKDYARDEREIRFDMFEAEFTHEGDMCTFEVLVRTFGRRDRALRSIGEIVHDIDLKEAKYGRPETDGVANILAGIIAGTDDDEERIERGGALFEDLYRFFSNVRT